MDVYEDLRRKKEYKFIENDEASDSDTDAEVNAILRKDTSLDEFIENEKSYQPSSDSEQSDNDADTEMSATLEII